LANPKLRLAIIEKVINFDAAPGSNGETEFFDVMRRMVPNATGTTLVGTWTNAQTQSFTFGVAMPTFIYDLLQIRVVGFIQTDGDKVVHQAGMSAPYQLSNYASIASVNTVSNTITCSTSITPSILIENNGTNPLTSAVVSYTIDGGTALTENFSGNIATGTSQNVNINAPITNLAPGEHTVIFQLQNINNAGINSTNISSTFYVIGSGSALNNYTENFANATGFNSYINISDDAVAWSRSTTAGFGTPRNSMKMDFYNSPLGKVDDVILPPFNTSGLNDPKLKFKVAGAPYPFTGDDSEDTLEVHYSLDCGTTWNLAWRKSGADLYTAPGQTTAYTANTDAAYRNDSTNLVGAGNAQQLLVLFRGRSNYGNNVYVDNINISATSALIAVSSTSPTCNGGTNGSATATPNFGTAPFTYLWNTTPAQTTQTAINLTAGTYSVTVTDQGGSSNTSSVLVGQPTAISASNSIVTNQTTSTPNGTISLVTAGGTAPYTFSWSNGNTTSNLTGLAAGSYSVTITDANGCTKSQSFTISNTTGVEEISSQNNIKLYPNPAQNNLNIVIENVQSNGNISIVDAIGKYVYSTSIEGKGKVFTNVDLTNISNGVYFVRVNSGNSVSVQKLIVKH
jgi:hypothetical protein